LSKKKGLGRINTGCGGEKMARVGAATGDGGDTAELFYILVGGVDGGIERMSVRGEREREREGLSQIYGSQ
jgi:hypothetical protein